MASHIVPTPRGDRGPNLSSDTPEILECQVCGFPVDPATGLLACDVHEAQAAIRGECYPARWEPTHPQCCGSAAFYCIDLADLADPRRVLWWTAHLRGKNWPAGTNWPSIIARAGGYV